MKKLSEVVKMVERYLNNCTYNFEIINCNVRKNKKDYEFNIIEYGPLGKIENEYSLYVNFNGENNILNVFGDILNNN